MHATQTTPQRSQHQTSRIARWMGWVAVAGIVGMVLPVQAQEGLLRTQVIDLRPGWNAVYLEVDPVATAPADVFGSLPIDVVATYTEASSGSQYVKNPTVNMLQSYGWAVWYAPARSDAFLSNLFGILGSKSYLILARTNATLSVTGIPAYIATAWQPNAYTLVGFNLVPSDEPTFAQFFRGSTAHRHNRIYRMVDGVWRQVVNPAGTTMRAGEAYWIYSDGRSDYNGPLDVSTGTRFGVMLDAASGSQVIFRNRTDHPIAFTVDHLAAPSQPIPLSTPVSAVDQSTGDTGTLYIHYEAGTFTQSFPALAGGQSIRWPLELRSRDAGNATMHSLLKITSDMGTAAYVPVTATRDGQ